MKKRSRERTFPEITPLIDVVFLLLIFFMVSTVFKRDELALLLNLPKTEKGEDGKNRHKGLRIELSSQEVAFNGKKTSISNLDGSLASVENKNVSIELRIDKSVIYDRIVRVLDLLKKTQIDQFGIDHRAIALR